MHFFEQELRKIAENSDILKDRKYVGRKCYGTVGRDIRASVELVTLGISEHYDGIKISLINRKEGPVDQMLIRFADILGKKRVNNPNFKTGLIPHIWKDSGEYEWYVYKPDAQDYNAMTKQIDDYLGLFQEESMEQSTGMQQMT